MTQSSYLMSFIRSLMENSKDIREKKKRQLERDFNETGAVLNTCLTEKFSDVNRIMNVYNKVSQRVSANRNAIVKIKRDLIDCKSLLYCNREELRRLWLELVEQRRCLELIDQLDRLRSTPDALGSLVGARAWPEATSLIINANYVITSEIASVPAVQSLKAELAHKQKFLIDELKKELDLLIFERPKSFALERRSKMPSSRKNTSQLSNISSNASSQDFEKSGASKAAAISQYVNLPLSEWYYFAVSEPIVDSNLCKEPRTAATAIALSAASNNSDPNNRHTNVQSVGWVREIVAVAFCLIRMQKLPQILCDWRPQSHISQMCKSGDVFSAPLTAGQGLLGQIHRSIVLKCFREIESKAIAHDDPGILAELSSTRYLIELLELVFDALFMNARCCLLLIRIMHENKQRLGKPISELTGLNSQYIWSCVQYEIFSILLKHLNTPSSADNLTLMNGSSFSVESDSVDPSKLDLNTLMGRKRLVPFTFSTSSGSLSTMGSEKSSKPVQNPTAPTTPFTTTSMNFEVTSNTTTGTAAQTGPTTSTLFSFSNTSHYMGMSSYLRETRVMTGLTAPDMQDQLTGDDSTNIYPLVCRPSRDNILSVYKIIMEFIEAIELEMAKSFESLQSPKKNPPNSLIRRSCQLRSHLKTFIENVYLPGTLNSLRLTLQRKMSAPNAINTVVSQQIEREFGLSRPILTVVHTVDECLTAVRKMCIALPEYRQGCIKIGLSLLDDFIASIWRIYKKLAALSELDASGTLVPSAEWSKDSDVSRFWKKFPTWQRMATYEARMFASSVLTNVGRSQKPDPTAAALNGEQATVNGEFVGQSDSASKASDLSTNSNLTPATAIALGLCGESETGFSFGGLGSHSRIAIPFANEIGGSNDLDHDPDKGLEYMRLPGLIYEREATRLAATETDQLIHMIRDELSGSTDESSLQLLPSVREVKILKTLGRLTESLCWLCQRVLSLDTWLKNMNKSPQSRKQSVISPKHSIVDDRRISTLDDSAFSSRARELNRFSEACLLMTYLEVRIQAYNHFGRLPPNITYFCPVDEVDVDKYVTDFLSYVEDVRDLLVHTFSRHKFRFIFDGLGDFISQLLLRLIPQISRMNTNGNKKMCRNVYRLQQTLATLTETHESDLIRVKQLYELFYLTPETIVNRLIEQGAAFDEKVYIDLMQLYQRSHSTYDYAKTQASISKLANVIRTNPK